MPSSRSDPSFRRRGAGLRRWLLALGLLAAAPLAAHPSGGPYGPLRRFELAQPLPGLREVPVSAEARKALGWSAPEAVPGAYPLAD